MRWWRRQLRRWITIMMVAKTRTSLVRFAPPCAPRYSPRSGGPNESHGRKPSRRFADHAATVLSRGLARTRARRAAGSKSRRHQIVGRHSLGHGLVRGRSRQDHSGDITMTQQALDEAIKELEWIR